MVTPLADPVLVADDIGERPGWAGNAGLAQRVNREVILLDQRGLGLSEPNLACPEVSSLTEELIGSRLSDPATRRDLGSAVAVCRSRLVGSGIDLSEYNLEENAADIEDLRQALGIAHLNLTAHGTASRILLEVVRRFPQHIRAVVLDTPQFPQASDSIETIQGTQEALGHLFADCASQAACHRRFPDLRRRDAAGDRPARSHTSQGDGHGLGSGNQRGARHPNDRGRRCVPSGDPHDGVVQRPGTGARRYRPRSTRRSTAT